MTIIKRADLGRPLTWDELDDNFRQVDELTASASAAVSSASASATAAAGSAANALNSANSAASSADDASASATVAINALMNSTFEPSDFDFTSGGTLGTTDRNKAVYNPVDNNWYSWAGTLPHVVAPGTDPAAVGSGYTPRTDVVLRDELADATGTDLVGTKGPSANTIQRTLSEKLYDSVSIFDYKLDSDSDFYPAFFRASSDAVSEIVVPAGEYVLDNSKGDKLANIVVFSNTIIRCEGTVTFKFPYNGLPLFTWLNATGGGMSGSCVFVFTGTTQTTDEYTVKQLITRLGITAMTAGGSYETRTVLLRVNTEYNSLGEKLTFKSQTPGDASHGICLCINDKGIEETSTQAEGNSIGECTFEDCIHGILSSRQNNFKYNGPFYSSRRFGHTSVAPGHVIYLSGGGPNGLLTNGLIGDVTDMGNPTTISDGKCLAPMAVKGAHDCIFGNLTSYHPEGLTQTYADVQNCVFGKQRYIYNGLVSPTNAQINFAGAQAGTCSNCYFDDITAISKNLPFKMVGSSSIILDGNYFSNISITCPPDDARLAGANNGIIDVFSKNNNININYTPTAIATDSYYQLLFIDRLRTDGNDITARILGRNASRHSCRLIDVGSISLDVQYSSNDIDRNYDSALCPIYRKNKHKTEWNSVSVSSGANNKTYQLPARGVYLIQFCVQKTSYSSAQAGVWLITYTDKLSLGNSQLIGSIITTGAEISGLSLSVNSSGLVTASYTASSAMNVNYDFAFTRIANITKT